MPSEYKLVLKHVDKTGYTNSISCYQKHGGYKTMKKVFKIKAKKTQEGIQIFLSLTNFLYFIMSKIERKKQKTINFRHKRNKDEEE